MTRITKKKLDSILKSPEYAPLTISLMTERCRDIELATVDFCESCIRPFVQEIRETGEISADLLTDLKETGWLGLLISRHYGGLGGDCLSRIVNVQYLARECPDLGAILQIAQLGTGSILEFGSEKQKLRWLPALASGERICTIAITEEHSGSHVLGMNTTYEETDRGFLLNGSKCFIGNCGIADLHVVYARKKGDKELSGFIVEGEREGVDNSEEHNHLGLRAFPFGRLGLTDVEIPRRNLLGRQGEGLRHAYYVIGHHGRSSLTALALGIHHRILDLTYTFARDRELYGKSIAELPDVRSKVFEIYSTFEQSRQAAYDAANRMSLGEDGAYRHLALAKYLSGDFVCNAANTAAEIFGARVGLPEFEIAQLTLDAMMTRPPSGTGDVQKKRIMDDFFAAGTSRKSSQVSANQRETV